MQFGAAEASRASRARYWRGRFFNRVEAHKFVGGDGARTDLWLSAVLHRHRVRLWRGLAESSYFGTESRTRILEVVETYHWIHGSASLANQKGSTRHSSETIERAGPGSKDHVLK